MSPESDANEEIDVWEVHPHLNSDYDYAVFDSHELAIDYAKQVITAFIDDAGKDEELQVRVRHTTMLLCEYRECVEQ